VAPLSAAEHIVRVITDYEKLRMVFEPASLNIAPGDSVTWVNEKAEIHTINLFPDGYPKGAKPFKSPALNKAGQRVTVFFPTAGLYEYHCLPHVVMGMVGRILVGRYALHVPMRRPTEEEITKYNTQSGKFIPVEDYRFAPWVLRAATIVPDEIYKERNTAHRGSHEK
jgi:pseudoazurin